MVRVIFQHVPSEGTENKDLELVSEIPLADLFSQR